MTKAMELKKKAMIEALEKTLGVVTTAAKIAGITRDIHYKWMREDDVYKLTVQSLDNVALDFVESQLHKSIQDGKEASIMFYLKCKGKNRGYIERKEFDIPDKGEKFRSDKTRIIFGEEED